ncbi:hypothetical protein ACHAQJ_008594 [Trichoderma viride]
MANSTSQEAQFVAQTVLPLRLSTPGHGCMDGASSHAVTPTALDSCQSATSASGSEDVFSSPPGPCVGQEPSSVVSAFSSVWSPPCLETLPSEVLAHIASFLDVDDLLPRSLVSIRLSRRLASRPSARDLVQRSVLPQECVPGMFPVHVAPGLVAKRKAIEKERLKDGLRRWVSGKWKGKVKEREEDARKYDETRGIGRVWRLRRFWERMSHGELSAHQNRGSRGSMETSVGW